MRPTAKPGNRWGPCELHAFNIHIVHEQPEQFFGHPLPPLETLDIPPAILNNQKEPPGCTRAETEFFAHLEDATLYHPDECSFMNDFTAALLKLMKYDEQEQEHIIHSYDKIPFDMCGRQVTAKVDTCVMEWKRSRYILPIQRDQGHLSWSPGEPDAQLIAAAVAAFQVNNKSKFHMNVTPIPWAEIPGIVMASTGAPQLYKIPVTHELNEAIVFGWYLTEKTIVKRLVLPEPYCRTFIA
ncbi:hypothetical protein HD554DRAFT_2214926 [Boletus coccyginus]|nr:hypothetical protein HD554DRAFT_2214926 [Boletus coccyginus]